jgi:DNA-binding transcriptional ArsR family regulator
MRILSAVIREAGLDPGSLARLAGVSERTLHRDLAALRKDGYAIKHQDGYQLQELLRLDGDGAARSGGGLAGVYEHQLGLLRSQVPGAVFREVERELEIEAPAALAALIASVLERRQP